VSKTGIPSALYICFPLILSKCKAEEIYRLIRKKINKNFNIIKEEKNNKYKKEYKLYIHPFYGLKIHIDMMHAILINASILLYLIILRNLIILYNILIF